MDQQSKQTLAHPIRSTRIAALGTLHDGEPNLAMVAFAFAEDFSAFYIHVSKLDKHSADMENDPRVSLLITETDDRRSDPQTLARVSLRGTAEILPRTDPGYARKIPISSDFQKRRSYSVWEISIFGRFVAGFSRAFHLVPEALKMSCLINIIATHPERKTLI